MRSFVLVVVCLLGIVPTVSAGSTQIMVVEDPAGDALAAGAAASPTHDWADLLKAEIEEVSDEAFTLRLFVAENGPIHADGVVLLNFLVGDQWFFMGYGALVFPGGRYEGGFFCPSDDQGQPTGECPDLPGASYGNGVFVVPDVSRALFGLDTPGAAMERPWMESGNHALATVWLRADRSDEGSPFVFQRGASRPIVAPADSAGDVANEEGEPASEGMAQPARSGESPLPSLVAVLGCVALAAFAHFKRRGSRGLS